MKDTLCSQILISEILSGNKAGVGSCNRDGENAGNGVVVKPLNHCRRSELNPASAACGRQCRTLAPLSPQGVRWASSTISCHSLAGGGQ